AGAEELWPQGDAVERALALERHARAGERLDRRARSAPGLSGHEQDARRLDVRQLRQLPCHVRREAPAEQRRVGPCRSSGGHGWVGNRRVRTLSWRWEDRRVERKYWRRPEDGRIWAPCCLSALERRRVPSPD